VDHATPFLTAVKRRSRSFPQLELPLDGGLGKRESQFNDPHPSGSLQLRMREKVESPWTEEGRELKTSRPTAHGTAAWSSLSWAGQGLGLCASLSKNQALL